MALPDLDVARVRRYVDERNADMPFDARDQVRYELDVAAASLTIVECRAPWHEDYGPDWTRMPVARLRYVKARREWSLYWRDQILPPPPSRCRSKGCRSGDTPSSFLACNHFATRSAGMHWRTARRRAAVVDTGRLSLRSHLPVPMGGRLDNV